MAAESSAQKKTIKRVMHEFKQGELEGNGGQTVRNPKQAIAIALSEAGASNQQSPKTNRRRLADAKRKQAGNEGGRVGRDGGPSRAALHAEAVKRNIPGRSKMNKAGLQQALQHAR